MRERCGDLLKEWCEALSRLQIRNTKDPRLDGGILCPACGRIHGRCGDAMYPFLQMARLDKNPEWIQRAKLLFEWTENTVSQPNGSIINDIDSPWDGITVFYAVGLADGLIFHGDLLGEETRERWKQRLKKAAEFLANDEGLKDNNINYPISNALALHLCGLVLKEEQYIQKAEELANLAVPCFTENGLLFGEGVPRFRRTKRGCRPVDIGYNVEESLPALLLYGKISGNRRIQDLAVQSFKAHLPFLMEDGGWDNSFGTRKFKWTYWGSRTSDGCALGCLLAAEAAFQWEKEFVQAAGRNLRLLKECTWKGLLAGGPHYGAAGQPICVHHTFSHAKVLAEILDRKMEKKLVTAESGNWPRREKSGIVHYPEVDTWIAAGEEIYAAVTAGDWEYLEEGHTSGGTLGFLYHKQAGPLFCAGPAQYVRKEPNNMQIPRQVIHECLALRIEVEKEGKLYSSVYEDQAAVNAEGVEVRVKGQLKDSNHHLFAGGDLAYQFVYRFLPGRTEIEAWFQEGVMICPLISRQEEKVREEEGKIIIEKRGRDGGKSFLQLEAEGIMQLPYGFQRIFNLTPGFQALRLDIFPKNGNVRLCLGLCRKKEEN